MPQGYGKGPYRSGYLVNRLISMVTRWESVFTMLRDLEPLFDHINISTAMHRLAKTSHAARVSQQQALACIVPAWAQITLPACTQQSPPSLSITVCRPLVFHPSKMIIKV